MQQNPEPRRFTEPAEAECTGCQNTGWEPVIDAGIRRVRKCQHQGCDYWDRKRGCALGVPEDERDSLLDNYTPIPENADAVKQARFFLDGVHPGLYVFGGVGCGKTRLACSILNELHKRREQVRFFRVPELLQQLMPGNDSTDRAFYQAVDVPAVVLDDVGANAGTDFSRRMLQSIFDARLDRGHRTIWTSNLDLDELAEFLTEDKRLPSRIAGHCKVVELGGPDWRLKKARAKARAAGK